MSNAIESRLRPAVEFVPAIAAGVAASALWTWPSLFLMLGSLAQLSAGTCIAITIFRAVPGLRVIKYRANLRRWVYTPLS